MNKNTSAIAVIGLSCWYPGASNPTDLWENILTKRNQFRRVPDQCLSSEDVSDDITEETTEPASLREATNRLAAMIDGFTIDGLGLEAASAGGDQTPCEGSSIVRRLILTVASQAVIDAGYQPDALSAERVGVVVSAPSMYQTHPLNSAAALREWFHLNHFEVNEVEVNPFNRNTESEAGADSSSLMSLATAAQSLANGEFDLMVVGGADLSLDASRSEQLPDSVPPMLDHFDRAARGAAEQIPGEGCGFVVLKRWEEACRDGDPVYAILRGWGISTDGVEDRDATLVGEGQSVALLRAYAKAGYGPQLVDFIEQCGDRTDLKAPLPEMKAMTVPRSCGLTSLESVIGYANAAAGIGGFIKAVMAVNRRVLPPMLEDGSARHDVESDGVENTSLESGQLDPKIVHPSPLQGECRSPETVMRAGVSAMSMGGHHCHVTLESGDRPSSRLQPTLPETTLLASTQDTELFILSADSASDLQQQVAELEAIAPSLSQGDLVDLAADLGAHSATQHAIRAAIIAHTPDELTTHLQWLAQQLEMSLPAEGDTVVNAGQTAWLTNGVKSARIGFLFPGHGFPLLNIARTLVERFVWAKELVQQADDWLQELDYPTIGGYLYRTLGSSNGGTYSESEQQALAQPERAQPAMCLASLLWMRYLKRLGIEPAAVGGHSLGELMAFHAAGAFDERGMLELAAAIGHAMTTSSEQETVMASLGCSRQQAETLITQVNALVNALVNLSGHYSGRHNVSITSINSPAQIVITGTKDSVTAVIKFALEKGIAAQILPVSGTFSSPFTPKILAELLLLSVIPHQLENPKASLFSCMNGNRLDAELDVHEYFIQHKTSPIDFMALIEGMTSACDLLIEVGGGQLLSSLVTSMTVHHRVSHGEATSSDSASKTSYPACFPIESRPGHDQDLNRALAAIFVHGGTINWDELYENRLVRSWVWPRQFMRHFDQPPLSSAGALEPGEDLGEPLSDGFDDDVAALFDDTFEAFEDVAEPMEVASGAFEVMGKPFKETTDPHEVDTTAVKAPLALSLSADETNPLANTLEDRENNGPLFEAISDGVSLGEAISDEVISDKAVLDETASELDEATSDEAASDPFDDALENHEEATLTFEVPSVWSSSEPTANPCEHAMEKGEDATQHLATQLFTTQVFEPIPDPFEFGEASEDDIAGSVEDATPWSEGDSEPPSASSDDSGSVEDAIPSFEGDSDEVASEPSSPEQTVDPLKNAMDNFPDPTLSFEHVADPWSSEPVGDPFEDEANGFQAATEDESNHFQAATPLEETTLPEVPPEPPLYVQAVDPFEDESDTSEATLSREVASEPSSLDDVENSIEEASEPFSETTWVLEESSELQPLEESAVDFARPPESLEADSLSERTAVEDLSAHEIQDTMPITIAMQLATLTNWSLQEVQAYLDTRGAFIAEVIKADWQHRVAMLNELSRRQRGGDNEAIAPQPSPQNGSTELEPHDNGAIAPPIPPDTEPTQETVSADKENDEGDRDYWDDGTYLDDSVFESFRPKHSFS